MRWVREDARSVGARLVGVLALLGLVVVLVTGSAAAARPKKLVEGTVYDTTCATACLPECPPPPHCGPIAAGPKTGIVCPMAERIMACPLSRASAIVCVQAEGCPGRTYPVWSGEGGVVKVRKRGSAAVLATVPIVDGHFKTKLAPGYYEVRPFLPERECWSGAKLDFLVTTKVKGPVPARLWVEDKCVADPGSG